MKSSQKIQQLTLIAMLCGIGIAIPMFAPKIVIGPASFTLASHVPIFLAMFISPLAAVLVSLITGLGFLFAGLPLVVVLRALSHVVFATIGAFVLKNHGALLFKPWFCVLFGLLASTVHAICEVIVVTAFYFGNSLKEIAYQNGYAFTVLLLVGVGTVVHSMIDFGISVAVWKPVSRIISIPVSVNAKSAL